jgi:hypothetical protein
MSMSCVPTRRDSRAGLHSLRRILAFGPMLSLAASTLWGHDQLRHRIVRLFPNKKQRQDEDAYQPSICHSAGS